MKNVIGGYGKNTFMNKCEKCGAETWRDYIPISWVVCHECNHGWCRHPNLAPTYKEGKVIDLDEKKQERKWKDTFDAICDRFTPVKGWFYAEFAVLEFQYMYKAQEFFERLFKADPPLYEGISLKVDGKHVVLFDNPKLPGGELYAEAN